MKTDKERIAELEDRVAELEWQVGELLGAANIRPDGITPCMYEVAALLSARAPLVVTKEALYHAAVLNLMESERPDNILKVQVVKLRKVLKVHGIEIQTVWGTGYRMTTENAANWRALVAKYNPQLEDAA